MNFPSVHEGGRKRGERTKAPQLAVFTSHALYIFIHIPPLSLSLERIPFFHPFLESHRAACARTASWWIREKREKKEKNIPARVIQGLFADRGRNRKDANWNQMGSDGGSSPPPLLSRIPCPPPFTGRARLQCQWKRPISVFTGNKEIPFRIERRSNELGEGRVGRGKQKQVGAVSFPSVYPRRKEKNFGRFYDCSRRK